MAGLVPAIHAFNQFSQSKTFQEARDLSGSERDLPKQNLDVQGPDTRAPNARDKPGHDDFGKY
jgi:hypothetical protein